MDKKTQINFWYIVIAIVALMIVQAVWVQGQQVERIPYSEFQQLLEEGRIAEIGISETSIRGTTGTATVGRAEPGEMAQAARPHEDLAFVVLDKRLGGPWILQSRWRRSEGNDHAAFADLS